MLSDLIKQIIERKLNLTLDEIHEKSSEQMDDYIEKNIIHEKLEISEAQCGLVKNRGYVLGLISNKDLNKEIDNFVASG